MSKVLVAVYSHSGDSMNGNHDKIRQTWGRHLEPWDVTFHDRSSGCTRLVSKTR